MRVEIGTSDYIPTQQKWGPWYFPIEDKKYGHIVAWVTRREESFETKAEKTYAIVCAESTGLFHELEIWQIRSPQVAADSSTTDESNSPASGDEQSRETAVQESTAGNAQEVEEKNGTTDLTDRSE